MDDPKNAESLLAIWKAYDNGDLNASKELFADTVEASLGDGSVNAPLPAILCWREYNRSEIRSKQLLIGCPR